MISKEQNERAQLDLIVFRTEDVILTSGEEYEDEILKAPDP